MNFGEVLEGLKDGKKYERRGWNGANMFIALQNPDDRSKMRRSYIYMSPIDGNLVPWVASHTDLLSNDWVTVL